MANLVAGDKTITNGIEQFEDVLMKHGLPLPKGGIIADGKVHRFSTSSNGSRRRGDGAKVRDDSGWYIYHDGSVPIAVFGDFRTLGKESYTWCMNVGREITAAEKVFHQQKIKADQERFAVEKKRVQDATQKKANSMLRYAKPFETSFPYLQKKGVQAHCALSWNDVMLVPAMDTSGTIHSVQIINAEGDKFFLKGGKVEGCFAKFGNVAKTPVLLIAEGFATAATIRETTNLPVIAAFNSGNLDEVARAIREKRPNIVLVFCADDDWKTMLPKNGEMVHVNPGMEAASSAAVKHNGHVIKPFFNSKRPENATDFNDMACLYGNAAVGRYLTIELEKIKQSIEQTKIQEQATNELTDDAYDADDSRMAMA